MDRRRTGAGRRLQRSAHDGAPRDDAPAGAFDHCAYCALQQTAAAPPDPRLAVAPAAVPYRALPPAFLHAPRTAAAWVSAQPRAPPATA